MNGMSRFGIAQQEAEVRIGYDRWQAEQRRH
jgi:hypothetical protein